MNSERRSNIQIDIGADLETRKEEFLVVQNLETVYVPARIQEPFVSYFVKAMAENQIKEFVISGAPQIGKSRIANELNHLVRHYSTIVAPYRKEPLQIFMQWYDMARRTVLESTRWKNYTSEISPVDPDWATKVFDRIAKDSREEEFREDVNNQIVLDYEKIKSEGTIFRGNIHGIEVPLIGKKDLGRTALNTIKNKLRNSMLVAVVPEFSYQQERSGVQERGNEISSLVLNAASSEVPELLESRGISIRYAGKRLTDKELGDRLKGVFRWVASSKRVIDLNKDVVEAARNVPVWIEKRMKAPKMYNGLDIPVQHWDNPYVRHMLHILLARKDEGGIGIPQNQFVVVMNRFRPQFQHQIIDLDFLESKNG